MADRVNRQARQPSGSSEPEDLPPAAEPAPLDADLLARAVWANSDKALAIGYRNKSGARKVAEILAADYARLAAGDKGSDR